VFPESQRDPSTATGIETKARKMSSNPNVIDRAFQIARDGPCNSVEDIREQLVGEGYDQVFAHLGGPTIRKDLLKLIKARKSTAAGPA